MKKLLIVTLLIFLTTSLFAEEKKTPDFSKMTNEELKAFIMETRKRKKEAEKKLVKAKKLNKTLDELNSILGIKE